MSSFLFVQYPLEKTKAMMLYAPHCPHAETEAQTDGNSLKRRPMTVTNEGFKPLEFQLACLDSTLFCLLILFFSPHSPGKQAMHSVS